MNTLRQCAEAADDFRIARFAVLAVAVICAIALPALVLRHGPFALYAWLLGEDGLYETVGTTFCLIAGLLFLALYVRPSGDDEPRRNPIYLAFGLGSVLMFCEEISWGQRLLRFSTPRDFVELNSARETTLHNLHVIDEISELRLALLLVPVGFWFYLGVCPWCLRYSSLLQRLFRVYRIPVADRSLALLLLTCPLAALAIPAGMISQEINEVVEFVALSIWFLFGLQVYRDERVRAGDGDDVRRALRSVLVVGVLVGSAIGINGYISSEPWVFILRTRAGTFVKQGDLERAATMLSQAVELRPNDIRLIASSASILIEVGRADEVVPVLESAIMRHPGHLRTLEQLVKGHCQLGNPTRALIFAKRIRRLAPERAHSHYLLGLSHLKCGNENLAVACLREALQRDLEHSAANRELATLMRRDDRRQVARGR